MRFSNSRSNRAVGIALAAASALVALAAVPHAVRAQEDGGNRRCSNASIRGSYGVIFSGVGAITGPPESFVAEGTRVFDGTGGFVATATFHGVATGILRADPAEGIYAVNSDCTGTSTLFVRTTQGVVEIKTDFVIVDNGKGIYAVVTSPPPNVVTETMRRQ